MIRRHVSQVTIIVNNPDPVRTMQAATVVAGPEEAGVIVAEVEIEVEEVIAEAEVEVLAVAREAVAAAEDDSDSSYIRTFYNRP